MVELEARPSLVCRVGTSLCAFPLNDIIETMRPLPVQAISGSPPFVRGVALIRGAATPVLDTSRLIADRTSQPGRLVTIRVADRTVALEVDSVLGIRTLSRDVLGGLPPLLHGARTDAVSSVAVLDEALLFVLRGACLLPDDLRLDDIDGGKA